MTEYKRGEMAYCKKCGDHLFTFSMDIRIGMPLGEYLFSGGQNFKNFEALVCKKCGEDFKEIFFICSAKGEIIK